MSSTSADFDNIKQIKERKSKVDNADEDKKTNDKGKQAGYIFKNAIQKIKEVKRLRKKIKIIDYLNCFLISINIALCLYIVIPACCYKIYRKMIT